MAETRKAGLRDWSGPAAVLLAVIGASAAAVSLLHARAEVGASAPPPTLPVTVARVTLEDGYVVEERYAGQVEPARKARLAFERAGLLTEVRVEDGRVVAAGEVVARLDARPLEIERRRLEAAAEQIAADLALGRATLERRRAVAERGFETGQSLDEARFAVAALEARAAEIEASLAAVGLDLEKSELRTPFAGTIAERRLDEGAVVSAGSELALLQETGAPRARIGLPPERAAALAPGEALTVEAGGREVAARLLSVSPHLDPATRTVAALFALDPNARLAMGDVARLTLRRKVESRGLRAPLAALTEGERGLWTLYVVEETESGPVARRSAVEALHVADGMAFVRGPLTEGRLIVTAGVNRLTQGQPVEPLVEPLPTD